MTNHLAKNHKISDLFRHLQVGQTECRKRRIWVGRVKLYIKCLPQSFYRRMQRFFAGQYFDYRQISQLIFN